MDPGGGWLDGGGLTGGIGRNREWYRFILATLAATRGIRDCDLEFFGTWTNIFFFNIFFVSLQAIY